MKSGLTSAAVLAGQPVSGQVGVHQQGMNAVGQLKAGVSKKGDLHTKASCHVFFSILPEKPGDVQRRHEPLFPPPFSGADAQGKGIVSSRSFAYTALLLGMQSQAPLFSKL